MTGSNERFTDIHRQALAAMRNIFMNGMGAFAVMQDQGEKLLRMVAEKGAEGQQARFKVAEEWISNLRKAQVEFRRIVEDSFKRAEEYFDKTKGE